MLGVVARRLVAESVVIVFAVRQPSVVPALNGLSEFVVGGLGPTTGERCSPRQSVGRWTWTFESGSLPRPAVTPWHSWSFRWGFHPPSCGHVPGAGDDPTGGIPHEVHPERQPHRPRPRRYGSRAPSSSTACAPPTNTQRRLCPRPIHTRRPHRLAHPPTRPDALRHRRHRYVGRRGGHVQKSGRRVIYIEPGEQHWHGATPTGSLPTSPSKKPTKTAGLSPGSTTSPTTSTAATSESLGEPSAQRSMLLSEGESPALGR